MLQNVAGGRDLISQPTRTFTVNALIISTLTIYALCLQLRPDCRRTIHKTLGDTVAGV